MRFVTGSRLQSTMIACFERRYVTSALRGRRSPAESRQSEQRVKRGSTRDCEAAVVPYVPRGSESKDLHSRQGRKPETCSQNDDDTARGLYGRTTPGNRCSRHSEMTLHSEPAQCPLRSPIVLWEVETSPPAEGTVKTTPARTAPRESLQRV